MKHKLSPAAEPTTKKARNDAGPVRGASFNIGVRPDLPAMATVRLRPRVELTDDRISRVVFGRTRTPSPFADGRMGDHTVAWQALVDSVHARVHGLTLREAIAAVRARQEAVQAWMTDADRDVAGRRLFRLLLDEMARRRPLLEDAAGRVAELLRQAEVGLEHADADTDADAPEAVDSIGLAEYDDFKTDQGAVVAGEIAAAAAAATDRAPRKPPVLSAASYLGMAIGQHLSYVNYLPFATVPALSTRGSVGSSESVARSIILFQEDLGLPKDAPLIGDSATRAEVTDALWGMFSFSAALREADTDLAVVAAAISTSVKSATALNDVGAKLTAMMAQYLDRPPALMRKDRPPVSVKPAEITRLEVRETLCGQATEAANRVLAETEQYGELGDLAGKLREAAEFLSLRQPGMVDTADYRRIAGYKTALARLIGGAKVLNTDLQAKDKRAVEDTALILAYLLRDHQETVARAYPRAVTVTGFLGDKPVAAAVARLDTEIMKGLTAKKPKGAAVKKPDPKPDPKLVQKLLDRVAVLYGQFGPAPQAAVTNDWTKVSASVGLVAIWDGGLQVSGRAPAPLGVEGMGSHTTAWALEVMALKAMLHPAAARGADLLVVIGEAVTAELEEGPIELDYLLPADQLASGQLHAIFDAALATLRAADVSAACTGYLTFRNLLPYATVDAGDRGGHGERTTATKKLLFDSGSLRQAAVQKADECGPGRRDETVAALLATATSLIDDGNAEWTDDTRVAEAVTRSITRLQAEARRLSDGGDLDREGMLEIVTAILQNRHEEHGRVYFAASTVA
jgi:hypothetical protein